MTTFFLRLSFFVALALLGRLSTLAQNKPSFSLEPNLLNEDGQIAPALGYKFSYDPDFPLLDSSSLLPYWATHSEGNFSARSNVDPELVFLETEFGGFYKFGENRSSGDGSGGRPDIATGPPVEQSTFQPLVSLSAQARYETDHRFDNHQILFGPEFNFSHYEWDELSPKILLPSLQLSFQWNEVLEKQDFAERGIEEDSFWRFGIDADWDFHVGTYFFSEAPSWLRGIKFQPRIAYFHGYQLPDGAADADLDEQFFFSGTLAMRLEQESLDWNQLQLDTVFVRVSEGALSLSDDDEFQVQLGFVVNFVE